MSRRRVVITGLGTINPLGRAVPEFWTNLIEGKSGIRPWTLFDVKDYKVKFGGEVCQYQPKAELIDKRLQRRMDRYSQFALEAAYEAIVDSGLSLKKLDNKESEQIYHIEDYQPFRMGVIMGSGIGGLNEYEEQFEILLTKNPTRVSPFVIPKLMVNSAAGQISIYFGMRGQNFAIATACASAANAMGSALRSIQNDEADLIITGGSEAAMTRMGLAGFIQCMALSNRNEEPQKACRPWDKDRDGFVIAEGAGMLVFEEYEHAKKRGARIYAEVAGYGATGDAFNITAPCPDGSGAAKAIELALKDAKLNTTDVDYINAHATSTPLGDLGETLAIKTVLGQHAYKIPVNATKSMTGHTLGASGGLAAIVCAKSIQTGKVHATINLDCPGEGCDLDYVPNHARDHRVKVAVLNSFGFGGHNACLVIKAV
jgi:3-oxoacyl-[acyl-carrier-protein] synthase II